MIDLQDERARLFRVIDKRIDAILRGETGRRGKKTTQKKKITKK